MEALEFYRGNRVDTAGRTLRDVLNFNRYQLEEVHDYIQWVFPLDVASGYNGKAPILSTAEIEAFQADTDVRSLVLEAFTMMLTFYGLRTETVDGQLHVVRAETFRQRSAAWITRDNHNFLRLTRILSSMRLLGFGEHARALLCCLEDLYPPHSVLIGRRTLDHWRSAVSGRPVSRAWGWLRW